jgi:hypothetical protein
MKIQENTIYRYSNLFGYFEFNRYDESYSLGWIDLLENDINEEQKQELIQKNQLHYIIIRFYLRDEQKYYKYVLCFPTQYELLYTIQDIMKEIDSHSFYSDDDLYEVFQMVIESDNGKHCIFSKKVSDNFE